MEIERTHLRNLKLIVLALPVMLVMIIFAGNRETEVEPIIVGHCYKNANQGVEQYITINGINQVVFGNIAVNFTINRNKLGFFILPEEKVFIDEYGILEKSDGAPYLLDINGGGEEIVVPSDAGQLLTFERTNCH